MTLIDAKAKYQILHGNSKFPELMREKMTENFWKGLEKANGLPIEYQCMRQEDADLFNELLSGFPEYPDLVHAVVP